jgi:aryl-alcohol dehydrogenase-like predicted oxidoreductase
MEYRTLGKTGLKVSPICIGAWQLGGPVAFDGKPDGHPDPGRENVLKMIDELAELGVNHIDTAEQYGAGESERRVGDAIRGRRDKWIVSTKFGYRVGPDNTREDDSSPPTILPSIEGSLRRLQTDHIDVYLYHCAPKIEDLDEGRAVLEKARSQGKIRHYGISTNNVPLIRAMAERGMIEVLQYSCNLLRDTPDIREIVRAHGIGTQLRGIMAQGRLSGKYFHAMPQWGQDDNRSTGMRDHDYRRYAIFERAVPDGYTMAQTVIRWILDEPCHHTICMGAKTIGDYRAALEAMEMPPLTEECKARLAACAADLRDSSK